MSYNEIPNILVDSVVFPNKPLSNLEIIVAAKKLLLCGFRGVFFRETHPKKTSKLIAHLQSPIFYNSERVQQNGEVFCGNLYLFALKQLYLRN